MEEEEDNGVAQQLLAKCEELERAYKREEELQRLAYDLKEMVLQKNEEIMRLTTENHALRNQPLRSPSRSIGAEKRGREKEPNNAAAEAFTARVLQRADKLLQTQKKNILYHKSLLHDDENLPIDFIFAPSACPFGHSHPQEEENGRGGGEEEEEEEDYQEDLSQWAEECKLLAVQQPDFYGFLLQLLAVKNRHLASLRSALALTENSLFQLQQEHKKTHREKQKERTS
ncbi:hypothetical protein QOT17_007333 [Balamuthia mandrillaris]